jgi:hypothetical protein
MHDTLWLGINGNPIELDAIDGVPYVDIDRLDDLRDYLYNNGYPWERWEEADDLGFMIYFGSDPATGEPIELGRIEYVDAVNMFRVSGFPTLRPYAWN